MKNINMDNDLGVLVFFFVECSRDLNGVYLKEGSDGEVDIFSSFKDFSLNVVFQFDEINIEILDDSYIFGIKVYEVVNEDLEIVFCIFVNREIFNIDECFI